MPDPPRLSLFLGITTWSPLSLPPHRPQPLGLWEDREGPCLPSGHVSGASLWHQLPRGSDAAEMTLVESHLRGCPVGAGSCRPTQDASSGDRKHRLCCFPKCQQGGLPAPQGAGDLPSSALPSLPARCPGWKKIQEIISFLPFVPLRLFGKVHFFFHTCRK